MMLKLWAFIYRHTGYYSPYAKAAEWRALMKALPELQRKYKFEELEEQSSIYRGMWQAKHGFYRDIKHFKKRMKRKYGKK